MTSERADLVILGSGPAGLAAAREAVTLGLSTVLVEAAELGGTCLNRGCIPTKLFLGATVAAAELRAQARLRVAQGEERLDLEVLHHRTRQIVEGTRAATAKDLAKAGVELVQGRGRLLGPGQVEISCGPEGQSPRTLSCGHCVVATGSRPAMLPEAVFRCEIAPGTLERAVLTSDDLLRLDTIPRSLLVIGAGAIGLEMAEFWSRLGTKIILVEALDRPAPAEDPEAGQTLARMLKREGWDLRLGQRVTSLVDCGTEAACVLASGATISAEKALVAIGRRANSENLGLESVRATMTGGGFVTTDAFLRAGERAYAVGDVNGRTLLEHAAAHQARYAVRHLAGGTVAAYDPGPMPACVYGTHEVRRAGAMPEALKAVHPDLAGSVQVSRAALVANPIAQAHGATQGFIKVAWLRDKVAGVLAVGHGVSHLATQASLLVVEGYDLRKVEELVFAHPSLDEALEAALRAPREAA